MADLKKLRESVGTQKKVAAKLGVSERFLRARESGEFATPPWLEYALKWLNIKK